MVEQVAPGVEVTPAFVTWKKALTAGALLLALAAAWRFTPLASLVSAEGLAARMAALGAHRWAIPLVVLAYTPAAYVVFPRALITIAAVLVFGPWTGFLCAVAGNLLAALITYLSGRLMRRDQVRAIAGPRVNALAEALRKRGLLAITAMRLVPIAPFVAENVVAGAIRIPLADYLLGTFLGMLPGEIASALFGAELQSAFLESSPVHYAWIVAIVTGLAAAALAVRRYLMKLADAQ